MSVGGAGARVVIAPKKLMNEAWRSAGAALGAKRGAHSSLRRFFLDGARKARTSHIT